MRNEVKGIRHLMEAKRFKATHLREKLIEKEVPGNWQGKGGLQNIYNLMDGRVVPKDGYTFVVVSEFLNHSLRAVCLLYSEKKEEDKIINGAKIEW